MSNIRGIEKIRSHLCKEVDDFCEALRETTTTNEFEFKSRNANIEIEIKYTFVKDDSK